MLNRTSIERAVAALVVGAMLALAERDAAANPPAQSDVHALIDESRAKTAGVGLDGGRCILTRTSVAIVCAVRYSAALPGSLR
jgi:hypothetical protein